MPVGRRTPTAPAASVRAVRVPSGRAVRVGVVGLVRANLAQPRMQSEAMSGRANGTEQGRERGLGFVSCVSPLCVVFDRMVEKAQ